MRPVSTVDAAATTLRNAIATGKLKPGQRIKEIPVAEELGLSRGPVREALRLLAEEGLVQISPNRGASVAPVDPTDLMEIYGLRGALGDLALRRLITIDADLTASRRQLQRLQRAALGGRVSTALDADLALQDELVRASGLARAAALFARTTVQLRVFIGAVGRDYRPVLADMAAEDADLLAVVAARDAQTVREHWHRKLERWARDFVGHLDAAFDVDEWLRVYLPD